MTAAVLRGKIAGLAMLAALSAGAPALSQDADQLWGWCFGDAPDDRTIQATSSTPCLPSAVEMWLRAALSHRRQQNRVQCQSFAGSREYVPCLRELLYEP